MRLLLDTHLLLWAVAEPWKLSPVARSLIELPSNEPVFSAASIWEVAIKQSLGRADFIADPGLLRRALQEHGWQELPITGAHAATIASLPPIHKDPFGRMLVAQAGVESTLLLTMDATLARYPGPIRMV